MVWIIIRYDAGSVVVADSSTSGKRKPCVCVCILCDIAVNGETWISAGNRNACSIGQRDRLVWIIIRYDAGGVVVGNSSTSGKRKPCVCVCVLRNIRGDRERWVSSSNGYACAIGQRDRLVWIIVRYDAGSVVVAYACACRESEPSVRVGVLCDIAIDCK